MRTNIIRIGNSQGIRIPKILLQQSQLGTEVEIEIEDGKIVISPISQPRQGWGEKFSTMAANGDDQLIDEPASVQCEWDEDEWQW